MVGPIDSGSRIGERVLAELIALLGDFPAGGQMHPKIAVTDRRGRREKREPQHQCHKHAVQNPDRSVKTRPGTWRRRRNRNWGQCNSVVLGGSLAHKEWEN